MENSIRLNLKPDGGDIEMAGQKSSSFLKSHGFSDEAVRVQIMILRELIHSGIKYGKFTPSKDEIIVHIQLAENSITLEVRNPVDETCFDRLKELDKTIQWIRGYQDPFEAYILKQKEASRNSSRNETNGLGLARIAYEGKAILDFFVSDDNTLNLFAVRHFDGNFRN